MNRNNNLRSLFSNNTVLLYLAYILALIPIICLRDFTPANELRYLSIADEAIENHNFFAFTNHGEAYADKPPLYLWGIMLCRMIAGDHYMWLLAFLSIIPAIVITRVFDRWTSGLIPDYARNPMQLMLLTTGLFLISSITLRMDIMMCMFIVLAFYEFWMLYTEKGSRHKHQWLLPLYVFLAVFTKGPLGFLIPLLCIIVFIVFKRRYDLFGRALGWRCWTLLLGACIVWFGSVYADGGREYLNNLLFHQTMDRAVKSFHHAAPFYYYFVCSWYCLVPWSLAILGLIISALRRRGKAIDLQSFFIIISLTTLVMLSCISSKIQIYMLPAVPFIVYASAISLANYQTDRLVRLGLAIIACVFAIVLPAFIAVKCISDNPFIRSGWFWLTASIMTVCGVYSLIQLYGKGQERRVTRAITTLSGCMLGVIFSVGLAMPSLNPYIGYKALATRINEKIEQRPDIKEIKCWELRRMSNIDVFVDMPLIEVDGVDYYPAHLKDKEDYPYILVSKLKLSDCLKQLKPDTVGKYCISIVEPKQEENE